MVGCSFSNTMIFILIIEIAAIQTHFLCAVVGVIAIAHAKHYQQQKNQQKRKKTKFE